MLGLQAAVVVTVAALAARMVVLRCRLQQGLGLGCCPLRRRLPRQQLQRSLHRSVAVELGKAWLPALLSLLQALAVAAARRNRQPS